MKFLIFLLLFSTAGFGFPEMRDPDRHDVCDLGYSSVVVAVSTSQVEAKIGASRDPLRQNIIIYNYGTSLVYVGPSGVTASGATMGIPVYKKQFLTMPVGDQAVYLISDGSTNVIVQVLK